MSHWRKFFPSEFLDESDLPEPVTVTIKSGAMETLQIPGRSKEDRLVLTFEKAKKRMVCNKTNARVISKAHGPDVDTDWPGKRITIYYDPTVMLGRDRVGGIRVRVEK